MKVDQKPIENTEIVDSATTTTINGDPASDGKITLDILNIVKTSQAANGLRHDDYQRYRTYCTRRLRRIRTALKFNNGRGKFVKKMVEPKHAVNDPRFLLIQLITAERAWAYAMELKAELSRSKPNNAEDSSSALVNETIMGVNLHKKHAVRRKLARAEKNARELRDMCKEIGAAETTVVDAEAYAQAMRGTWEMERENWQQALEGYTKAKHIYQSMAQGLSFDKDLAQMYQSRVEELEPSIRFCKYNASRLSGGTLHPTEEPTSLDIGAALEESRKQRGENFGSIEWCGELLALRTEKLNEAWENAQEQILTSEKEQQNLTDLDAKASLYDKVLIAYNDVIRLVAKDISDLKNADSKNNENKIRDLIMIQAFFTYNRIAQTIQRNLLLIEAFKARPSAKSSDFVRLYENVIQNVTDMMQLEGVDRNSALKKSIESKLLYFRAHRCYALAQNYEEYGNGTDTVALYDRAKELALEAAAAMKDAPDEKNPGVINSEKMQELADLAKAKKIRFHAHVVLSDVSLGATLAESLVLEDKKTTMCDNLQEFKPYGSIVMVPPALESVPAKPILFDIASDGVGPPESLVTQTKTKLKKQNAPQETKAQVDSQQAQDATQLPTEPPSEPKKESYFSRWFGNKK